LVDVEKRGEMMAARWNSALFELNGDCLPSLFLSLSFFSSAYCSDESQCDVRV
jgi:hypothetical protein